MNNLSRHLSVFGLMIWLLVCTAHAQKISDKKIIRQLKADIEYLASDSLEGRRTATDGERKAYQYIESRYRALQINPYKDSFVIPFHFIGGKEIGTENLIMLGEDAISEPDGFPLPFSSNTSGTLQNIVLPEVFEPGNIWLTELYKDSTEAEDAHFDYEKTMYDRAKEAKKNGASAVIFFDSYDAKFPPQFNRKSELEILDIPVVFLSYKTYHSFIQNNDEGALVALDIALKKTELTGHNVAAYIDNKAAYTVVLGAHYDHLGYGEDNNSMYTGKDKLIHNGADDNASGTAALMQMAYWIQKNKLKKYNYLFIHFSGEELGLLGSKAFVKDMKLDSNQIAYMLNMDMVGRLNDSTHALTIGGVGTSPAWAEFTKPNKNFRINIDSSGVGPSDHTSFYYAGIPVLFFFTGLHHDYHKPSDDADKINYKGQASVMHYIYNLAKTMEKKPKPIFTPTKQSTVGKVRFKVTLGIMPDYSYQEENGVRVDGVSDDRPAIKAGIKPGDIITQLGENKIQGMQSYMEALGKFKPGEKTTVTVMRNGTPITMAIEFNK